jgi:S-adenosylmethionine:tRNA ribosyltransferase-isomerase
VRFQRHDLAAATRARTSGGGATLRADEVSRHAMRLVVIDRRRSDRLELTDFARLPELLAPGDVVVVNDAATLPASLAGMTARGEQFELRLAGPVEGSRLAGVLFGPGDHRTRTEDRLPPPRISVGEQVQLGSIVGGDVGPAGTSAWRRGSIAATVAATAGRRIELLAPGGDALWQALYETGKPVQYAHRPEPLPLYAVQTAYAARPWASEMPSAGRGLTWEVLLGLRRAGVALARLTHAAGLSSTGDEELDRALPWPERYELPRATVDAIGAARARGGRIIAIGTTVVRALESAAPELRPGGGVARLRLDAAYSPQIVDGLVSGLHSPGESHFELLRAFVPRDGLCAAIELAAAHGLSAHELGDACLIL